MSLSTAAGFPSWIMMDRFVFRRDDDDGSFPDDDAAPMRASSFTSLGEPFTVALQPAAPPAVSRLYVRCPPGPQRAVAYEVATAHRGLFLVRVTSYTVNQSVPYRKDYFVFKATAHESQLERLPAFSQTIVQRWSWFHNNTIGLVSRIGDGEEYALVHLAEFIEIPGRSQKKRAEISEFDYDQLPWRLASDGKMGAELCVFRSHLSSSSSSSQSSDDDGGVVAQGNWEILTLPIQYREEELCDLLGWSTDGAITFNDSICWFDYNHGGILSYTPPPLGAVGAGESFISYVRMPIDNRPINSIPKKLEMYRSLCVIGQRGDEQLKFVDVAHSSRHAQFYGRLWNGDSFTITCHTFTPTGDQMWNKDVMITSDELWRLDPRERLMPRSALPTFPLVSRDEPHLVHFLMSEPRDEVDKVSVVVIDIITRTVVSVFPYIQGGEEDLCGKDADMIKHRCRLPWPFLPSRF
ncbi:hypothetical protein ACQ4PT_003756 [Festuca glaucescens]